MKSKAGAITGVLVSVLIFSCSRTPTKLSAGNLELVNRSSVALQDGESNTLKLNSNKGDGMAVLKTVSFESGTLQLQLKGEDKPGKSFVGVAFNIQNDSTYEAIYFRPFNFRAKAFEKSSHAVQYISHPKNTWRFLRTNDAGRYESEFINAPLPDAWFGVTLKVAQDSVYVYDRNSNTEIMKIKRLESQASDKIGLWVGNNSSGAFRNLSVLE